MLDRLAPLTHLLRMLVKPTLHGFENMLVLPTRDPSLLARSAVVFDRAVLTGIGPVAAQDQPIFLVRVVVGEPFTGGADIDILFSHVAEVLLAELPFRLGVRGHRFWQRDRDACFLARQDLLAVEVAAARATASSFSTSSVAFVSLAMWASCDRSCNPTLLVTYE